MLCFFDLNRLNSTELRQLRPRKLEMSDIINQSFFQDIKKILRQSRQKAYAAVNYAMIVAYWKIGKRIAEEEQADKQQIMGHF